jgi:hypothetical protein
MFLDSAVHRTGIGDFTAYVRRNRSALSGTALQVPSKGKIAGKRKRTTIYKFFADLWAGLLQRGHEPEDGSSSEVSEEI